MQKKLPSSRETVRSNRIASSANPLLEPTSDPTAPPPRECYLRFVPLNKGGIVRENDPERRHLYAPTLKPGSEEKIRGFRREGKTVGAEYWTWPLDRLVRIDESHTPMQVLQQFVAEFDELKHLASLTPEQLHDFVTLDHGDRNLLDGNRDWDRTKPIEFSHSYGTQTDWGYAEFPILLRLVFPLVIEERLLQTVPRDDTKPLLWLDVDGVVNGSLGSDEQQKCDTGSGHVRYSPQIVSELNRLSKVCDIHWATSWGKRARFRLAPAIGLNDFNVWKGKGTLDDVVNFDRPLIWIDDQLDKRAGDGYWIREKAAPAVRAAFKTHLLLAPHLGKEAGYYYDRFGLTMEYIAQIDAFLAAHTNK